MGPARGRRRCADQTMWRAFLAAEYFQIPPGQCKTCKNGTEGCGKFFCVECRVGNVCEGSFQPGGEHSDHPSIRVWMVSGVHMVCVDDVKRFMPSSLVHQIQLMNHRRNIKLFRSEGTVGEKASTSRERVTCCACEQPVPRNAYSERPVCSLMCLLDDALARSVRYFIEAIDARMPEEWSLIGQKNN